MSRKYNYIGFTSDVEKSKLPMKNMTSKEYSNLSLSFFCACGNVFKLTDNRKSDEHLGGDISTSPHKSVQNTNSCNKCKGESLSKKTITLNSKLRDNVINSNYKVFTDGDLIKLVRFDDLLGVASSGKKLYMVTNKSSICFNKKTKTFYYYRSYRRGNKIVKVGLRDISTYFTEFMWRMVINQKACFNEINKVHLFKDINTSYIKPFNEFLNILLQFIDKRDLGRLTHFLEPLRLSDVPTVNQLSVISFANKDNNKNLLPLVIQNFQLVISLIQYPNLSVLLFNIKKEKYISLLSESAPVSFFKKRKDLPQREIVKNIYIGKLDYYRKIKRDEFKYDPNNKEGVTYSSIKKKFSKILIPENFSKFKINTEAIEDFALKNNLINKKLKDIDIFDIDNLSVVSYNTIRNLKLLESTSEYIKFVRKNKLPRYIVKDFIDSPTRSLVQTCQIYYLMLYNEIFDESEFCLLAKKYKLTLFTEVLEDFFNILDYYEAYNYVNSYEDAKESSVFINHLMKLIHQNPDAPTMSGRFGMQGYERSNFIRVYKDTIEIFREREMSFEQILKCKTKLQIEEIHDHWSQIISLERMEKFNDGIKSFSSEYYHIKEYLENDIEFILIDNVKSLSEEGSTMRHCVKSYAKGMSEGKHLIFSVKDLLNGERATLEFAKKIKNNGLTSWTFSQLKGKYNSQCSERIISSIKLFVENFLLKNSIKVNISYKEWDLLIQNEKSKKTPEQRDFYVQNDAEIDNIIEDTDWIIDNDLPF
jgi:hypothetical protein